MSEIANRELYEEVMGLAADGTLSHLRRLLKGHDGYVGHMSHWTGRYARSDRYVPRDAGWLLARLWGLFVHTQDQEFRDIALRILRPMIPDLTEKPLMALTSGCDVFFGLCLGAEATGSAELHDMAVKASKNLVASLWSERLGRFRSWLTSPENEVALEWGAHTYHLAWTSHVVPQHLDYFARHHEAVLAAGLVRPDGSTAHVAFLDDNGKVQRHESFQGYSADSTWARGQSWAMHNFRVVSEAAGRPALQEASERLNAWWLTHLPEDWVPFYDFDDPDRELGPRDSDSAAIATSVLMRLYEKPGAPAELANIIDATLTELCRNYITQGGVMIHGSMGKIRPLLYGMETTRLPPGHSSLPVFTRFPQEELMGFGNYFIVETLHRRLTGAADFPSFLASAKFR
jgi:unsaturated chondroitin disaccharide hydrolase